jgi:cytochrome c5
MSTDWRSALNHYNHALWPSLLTVLALLPGLATAELTERQMNLLANNCLQCHARPGIGVPMMGDAAAWKDRLKQGESKLLANVVLGLRGMPPLGYCSACSEQDLRDLSRMLAGFSEVAK